MNSQGSKPLVGVCVCVCMLVGVVNAAPTVTLDSAPQPTTLPHRQAAPVAAEGLFEPLASPQVQSELSCVGAELLLPNAINSPHNAAVRDPRLRSLPAVPAAMLLVVFGAGLVLFVDNRRHLAACCATLALLGNAGVRLLPNLATRSHTTVNQSQRGCGRNLANLQLAAGTALPKPAETLGYVGLLHRLAESADPASYSTQLRATSRNDTPRRMTVFSCATERVIKVAHALLVVLYDNNGDANAWPLQGQTAFTSPLCFSEAPVNHSQSRGPPARATPNLGFLI